jgi:protein SCO1/2
MAIIFRSLRVSLPASGEQRHKPCLRIALIVVCLILSTSCRPRGSGNEQRYDLKGKVVAVNKADRTATIDHEEIPGYMPAMTMDFLIKRNSDLEMIKPGDQVTGTLIVDDASSWLEITTRAEGVSPLAPTAEVPGEAKPGDEIPDFSLVNQDGKQIRLSQYRGSALALTFIYTRCPEATQCPLMSTNFAAIEQELQKDKDVYSKTHLLSVSFDPAYDTPKVLRSYGAGHTGRYSNETFKHWEFATGSEEQVKSIAQHFGVRYFLDPKTGKDQIIHSLRTAVIGPDGKLIKLYRGNEWKPHEIAGDLKALVAAQTK